MAVPCTAIQLPELARGGLRLGLLALFAAAPPARADFDEWRWQQVLASPRIGGRLTAVGVDPEDPARIYVGTEEGTLIVSTDGGLTWDERALTPFVIQARSVGLRGPAPPDPSSAESARLRLGFDPPDRFFADDLPIPFFANPAFATFPPFMGSGFPPYIIGDGPEPTLLPDAVESRRDETNPVHRIVVCPGAELPLLVSTERELYGSRDGGVTSLRLFFVDREHSIAHVACSPWRKGEIALSTSMGLFRSRNGGVTFEPALTGRPGPPSTAVVYARDPARQHVLYHATDGELYGGDPDSDSGLEFLYPEEDPSTAPWEEIRWIDATPEGALWMATEDGLRRSSDGGERFENVAPALFGTQAVSQVLVGAADGEGRRVAALLRDVLYASDDDGRSWYPFFRGASRRSLRQVASGPSKSGVARWWLVTSGELWTTVPPRSGQGSRRVDEVAQRWAKLRLERTPSLARTLDAVLEHNRLSPERLGALADAERARAYVPYIDVLLTVSEGDAGRELQRFMRTGESERSADNEVRLWAQATWDLGELYATGPRIGETAKSLYELRRQVSFAAEDAWHERWVLLERMAAGMSDAVQIAVLKARIDTLEVVLDTWGWRGAQETRER